MEKGANVESFSVKYGDGLTKLDVSSGNLELLSIREGKKQTTILYPYNKFKDEKKEFYSDDPKQSVQYRLDKAQSP